MLGRNALANATTPSCDRLLEFRARSMWVDTNYHSRENRVCKDVLHHFENLETFQFG